MIKMYGEELKNENVELYNCLSYINTAQIRELTISCLNTNINTELAIKDLEDAISVTNWLIFLLKTEHILTDENKNSYFTDLLIASSLLHNLNYKYNVSDWTIMFKTRNVINKMNIELGLNIPENYITSIATPIETQLGKDMPNSLLIPNVNTPGAHIALACAIHYNKQ